MCLKIVSGVLVTKAHTKGRTVVDLSRNEIVEGDLAAADLQKERTVAPDGMRSSYFDEPPCSTVGLRQIKVETIDRDDFGSRPPIQSFHHFSIDSSIDTQRLTVEWGSERQSLVEEISYLVIGPVSRPPSGPG